MPDNTSAPAKLILSGEDGDEVLFATESVALVRRWLDRAVRENNWGIAVTRRGGKAVAVPLNRIKLVEATDRPAF